MAITEAEARRRTVNAKRCVAKWFDETDTFEKRIRPKLLRAIENFSIAVEGRSRWFEVSTIALGTIALPIAINNERLRSYPCRESLSVTTISPLLDVGLDKIIKDAETRRAISWFLHYAKQYIHRSEIAKVLRAHPRSSDSR